MPRQKHPPRALNGTTYPDSRPTGDVQILQFRRIRRNPEGARREREPAVVQTDSQRGPHAAGPSRETKIGHASPVAAHLLESVRRTQCANQHRGSLSGTLGHQVQAVMHAIREIHVGPGGVAEHHA